jgi:hypothetical protein
MDNVKKKVYCVVANYTKEESQDIVCVLYLLAAVFQL